MSISKPRAAVRNGHADLAQADDAQRLAAQLAAGELGRASIRPGASTRPPPGCGGRATNSSARVCSAAATVLPVGALTTTMPAAVAAAISMLSTPTPGAADDLAGACPPRWPRRPPGPASGRAARRSSGRMARNSSRGMPSRSSTSWAARRRCRPSVGERLGDQDAGTRTAVVAALFSQAVRPMRRLPRAWLDAGRLAACRRPPPPHRR